VERRSKRNVWWYKTWQRPSHASVIFIGQTLSTKSRVMRGSPCHGTVIVVNRISIILSVASERQRTFSYWRAARARHRRNFGDASWGDRSNGAHFSAPSARRPQGGCRAGPAHRRSVSPRAHFRQYPPDARLKLLGIGRRPSSSPDLIAKTNRHAVDAASELDRRLLVAAAEHAEV